MRFCWRFLETTSLQLISFEFWSARTKRSSLEQPIHKMIRVFRTGCSMNIHEHCSWMPFNAGHCRLVGVMQPASYLGWFEPLSQFECHLLCWLFIKQCSSIFELFISVIPSKLHSVHWMFTSEARLTFKDWVRIQHGIECSLCVISNYVRH